MMFELLAVTPFFNSALDKLQPDWVCIGEGEEDEADGGGVKLGVVIILLFVIAMLRSLIFLIGRSA